MATITYRQLKLKGACAQQLEAFKLHFGQSAEVTTENALKVAQVFDWNWAANRLLSDQAWINYHAAIGPARKLYDTTLDTAVGDFNIILVSAEAIYRSARAVAFAEAYLGDAK